MTETSVQGEMHLPQQASPDTDSGFNYTSFFLTSNWLKRHLSKVLFCSGRQG